MQMWHLPSLPYIFSSVFTNLCKSMFFVQWKMLTRQVTQAARKTKRTRCKMLIGGDDISNDAITIGACFHVFFNVCLHSRSFPLRADMQTSDSSVDGEPQGNERRKFQKRSCQLSFLFPPRGQSAPESLLAGYLCHWLNKHLSHVFTRVKTHHHISIIRLKCIAVYWRTAFPVNPLSPNSVQDQSSPYNYPYTVQR